MVRMFGQPKRDTDVVLGPGKKFSQVEFVRVIFSLFAKGSRVKLIAEAGESEQAARARVLQIVAAARVEVTLKIVDSERIKLRWMQEPITS